MTNSRDRNAKWALNLCLIGHERDRAEARFLDGRSFFRRHGDHYVGCAWQRRSCFQQVPGEAYKAQLIQYGAMKCSRKASWIC